jgi:DivIVA domain-containing protein
MRSRQPRRLTSDDVVLATFRSTKLRQGYDQVEVDDFLDTVAASMRELEASVFDLEHQAVADRAEIARLRQVLAAYQPTS